MTTMLARIKAEPAVVISFVGALIALAVAFGFHLTADQTAALMAVATLAVGFVTRSQVSPVVPEPPAAG